MNQVAKFNKDSILDWDHYEKQARSMTMDELKFAQNDASEASLSLRGVDVGIHCKGEGFYSDEASVYGREIMKREMRKKKRKASR